MPDQYDAYRNKLRELVGLPLSPEELSNAAHGVAMLWGIRNALDNALTPGGSAYDHVRVALTK